MLNVTGVSSFVVLASLTATGGVFTEVTLMKMVSRTHNAGNGVPSSHICTITVSGPL